MLDGDMEEKKDHKTSLKPKKNHIFLFKAPKENEVDKFSECLSQEGISSSSIPVLSFKFVNQSELKGHLSHLGSFSGIILTSVRGVEAVANLLPDVGHTEQLSKIRCFVPGQTTFDAAVKAGFRPEGENSGNADSLSEYIIHNTDVTRASRLLYPCSNIHRDTLKDNLTKKGFDIVEVVSYETCPNSDLAEIVTSALRQHGCPEFAAFFSPSGFQYMQPLIQNKLFPIEEVKIIALGPVTEKAILDLGYTLYGTAKKPEPSSIVNLLMQAGENKSQNISS